MSCFRSIDEIKIAGENEKVCVKAHRSFFSVHEIDHPSNIYMSRTVEQLAESSAKKKNRSKNLNEAPKPFAR